MLISLLGLTALQVAATAPSPKPETGEEKRIVKQIIIHEGGDKQHAGHKTVERDVVITRPGSDLPKNGEREIRIIRTPGQPPAEMAMIRDCEGARKFETEADGTSDGKKTKTEILLCSKGGETDATWVQRLRDTAKRIEGDENLSPETKAQVVAALNQAITQSSARE